MVGKNKSRKARRTGSPIGNQEESSPDYEVTEEVYEVECIVGHRERRNGMEYKVRWRGWSPQFDEWLPYTKMDCPDVIKAYWENVEKEKEKKRRMSTSRKRERSDSVSSSKSDQKMPSGDSDHRPRSRQMFDQFKSRSKSPFVDAKAPTVPQNIDSTGEPAVSDRQDGCSNASPLLSATPHAATENQSTSTSACSSPPSSQQPILRKVVKIKPIPPALPNRKVVKSTFNVSCSSTSAAPSTSPAPKCAPVVSAENLNESTSYGSVAPESVKETGICNGITETNEESKDAVNSGKRFVRPHGFERGLTVERIHGFIERGDQLFAAVQFKHCDVVEILSTKIIGQFEPMALTRGFEEHRIRSHRNKILSPISS
ncbi:hypothetical protein Q1695_008888 [Nippostrongylus brasiliensis]|nr:hypothetical protein Q1695_008888 [Nippostrongylus brasiliensis]